MACLRRPGSESRRSLPGRAHRIGRSVSAVGFSSRLLRVVDVFLFSRAVDVFIFLFGLELSLFLGSPTFVESRPQASVAAYLRSSRILLRNTRASILQRKSSINDLDSDGLQLSLKESK